MSRHFGGLLLAALLALVGCGGEHTQDAFTGRVWQALGAPSISGFSPASGAAYSYSNTPVTLTGSGFTGTTVVRFNGVATPFTVNSDTQVTAYVPEGATTGRISVTNGSGTALSATAFTVIDAPELSGFSPQSGTQGAQVVLTGRFLTGATEVYFGSTSAPTFTVNSDTQLTVTVPPGAQTGALTVATPGGRANVNTFTVLSSGAPTLTSFSPTSVALNNSVTLTGTNFTGTTSVSVGGATCYFSVDSDTQLSLYLSDKAATGPIRITNTRGSVLSASSLTVVPGASLTGFSPASGKAGSTVTIAGSGFTGTYAVYFGNMASPSVTVVSDTQLTATVPVGATTGTLAVSAPSGYLVSASPFTVLSSAAPTVTSLSPASGPAGTRVTVSGTNFTGLTDVFFNGVRSTSVSVSSDTGLSASVPAGATSGAVRVTNTVGSANSASSFTVTAPPALTSLSPLSGPVGTVVTVTGSGFTGATSLTLGGMSAPFQVVSGTQVTFLVPAGAVTGTVRVGTPSGSVTSSSAFSVTGSGVPVITSFSPGAGGPYGNPISIKGSGFTGATDVSFNGVPASSWALTSDGLISAYVPEGATTGPIRVTTSAGTGTSGTNFVIPTAKITAISPTSGPAGTVVTLTGSGFTNALYAYVSNTSAVFQVVSDTQLLVTVPRGARTGQFTLVTPSTYVYSADSFTVQASAAPTLTRFTPASAGIGVMVSLYGTGFTGASEVLFNGVPAWFNPQSDEELIAYVPDSATSGRLSVRNALGTALSSGTFTVLPPPVISAFSPASGTAGTTVTLTGTGFSGTTYVTVGNQSAASFTVVSDTQLTLVVPSGVASGPITVQGPAGGGTSSTRFTVLSSCAPTVSSFSPASGGRYTNVIINGTCFTGLQAVSFNGVDADSFYLSGDSRVQVSVPGGATTGPLRLTNSLGSATSATPFTVLPPPTITGVSPTSGKPGATVTVTGTGFTGATRLTFFRNLASSFTVDSDTQITATVPSGVTTGSLSITAPGGSSTSAVKFNALSAVAPSVASFSPDRAGVGTPVEVLGSGFTGTTRVTFNGLPASTVQVTSDTRLVAFVPSGATSGRVSVINTVGSGLSSTDFTVLPPPTVAGFSPTRGGAGTTVTVTGTGFTGATGVYLNGRAADFSVGSDNSLTLTVPFGSSSGPLIVEAPGGTVNSDDVFTVLSGAAPSLGSLYPTSGGVGTQVSLTGSGFTGVTGVSFNGARATEFSVATDTQLWVAVPPAATTGKVTVYNTVGSATSSATFTVLPPPVVSGFSPGSGGVNASVTLTGSGFTGATGVFFGTVGSSFTVVSDTQITAKVPAGASTGRITVEGVNGSGSSSTSFTVQSSAAPVLTSFTPTRAGRNARVTLAGSNFTGVTGVSFNGVAATTFFVDSDFQVRAYVPRGATTGPLTITNTAGSSTSVDTFTVLQPPTVTGFTPDRGGAGTTVTVTGTGFADTTGVFFGDLAAAYDVQSDTQLTVVVPVGATSAAIAVRTGGGYGYASSRFTVLSASAPTITGFVPATGGEGRLVQVSGTNFTGVTGVSFNGTPAAQYTVNSDTLISARVPRGATTGRLQVTNTAGSALSSGAFTVLPGPVLASFAPASGGAGTVVTVTGSGFSTATTVRFAGLSAGFTVTNDTQLSATVPFGAVSGPIEVLTQAGTATSSTWYTVPSAAAPSVSSFTPSQGGAGIGLEVTLVGTNFSGATAVKFNASYAESFRVVSDSQLVAVVPVGATTGRVSVTNNVSTGISATNFTVLAPPTVTSFTPASGTPGTTVTLTGTNLTGATAVRFGSPYTGTFNASSFTVVSPTQVTATVPFGVMSGPITVTTPAGVAVSKTDFTVQSAAKPQVDEFGPVAGLVGTMVHLDGFNLSGVTEVRFNGVPATILLASSDVRVWAAVPAGATSGPITVVNSAGSATTAKSFTVGSGDAPSLSSVSPASAPRGSVITLTGSNLSGCFVYFSGSNVNDSAQVVSNSGTSMQVVVPADAQTGYVDVYNDLGDAFVRFTIAEPARVGGISPSSGSTNGGTAVTVTGLNFAAGATVSIGGVPATGVTVVDASTLTATTGVHPAAGLADVVVTNANGLSGTLRDGFTYNKAAAPTLASISPASGRVSGGTVITLTGSGFAAGATVKVGGAAASGVTVTSATSLTATTPAGTAGKVDVVVTNPDGQAVTLTQGFTYVPAPTLASISPTSGRASGGTSIALTGSNFQAGATVTVGGVAATGVTVSSATSITATTPAGTAGTADVVVTNPDGQSATLSKAFTYVPAPVVSAVSPASGRTSGGTVITVTGANFLAGATVKVGGAAATNVTVASATSLTATTPAGAAGAADVVVTNPDGQAAAKTGAFTYVAPPTLTSLTPTSGRASGGTVITLTGSNFVVGSTVKVGGTAATNVTFIDTNTLSAITPAGAVGTADVVVTNPDGQAATLSKAFTYVAPPALTSVSPSSGSANGGTQVTLTGTGFVAGATVSFGGVNATNVVFSSATSLSATTPAHGAGAVDVVVTNPDGQTATLTGGFTFNPVAAPAVTAISPNNGPSSGGTQVTITGNNFAQGATVSIGGVAATNVVVSNLTTVTATVGGHAAGTVDVVVRNPDGQSGTLTGGYTYNPAPAPTLVSITPSNGLSTGGTQVTLTGTNFAAGATVLIGGNSATNVTVTNSTTLTATTPAHAAGVVDVVVTNADGQSATKTGAFNYDPAPAPVVSAVSPGNGSSTGGTVVTVSGSNFVAGATVLIGGNSATSVTVTGSTSLQATTPAHAAGAVDVVVRNPDGQAGTKTGGFTYNAAPAPVVTAVSPTNGPASGGTSVIINGSNFVAGALVTFGGSVATNVSLLSANVITATTPAHASGTVDVMVLNLDGQSGTKVGAFTYDAPPAPVVASISPNHGPATGGTQVSISGSNFGPGASITIGGVSATSVNVLSANSISAVVPAHAAGAVDVVVKNADAQVGTLAGGFTYDAVPAPVLASLSPGQGSTNGGTQVTLSGANFVAGATVTFGGVAATSMNVASANSISLTTPAHTPGAVDVTVRNPDGQVSTLAGAFTYVAPSSLTVTGITPQFGPTSGGTSITLSGTSFAAGATVTVGGVPATGVTVASATSLTATTPAHTAGTVDVVVTNPNNEGATLARGFTYEQAPAPTVSSLNPSTGSTAGGTAVTLTGTHFAAGARVRIGGVEASSVVVASPTSLTAVTPPHAAGAVAVEVTNADGQTGTLGNGFTYTEPQSGGGGGGSSGGDKGGGCSSTAGGPMNAAPVVLLALALLARRRRAA